MENLDEKYWDNRYLENNSPWNLGTISTPLKEYIDQLDDKAISILIPGCGYGYEGEYLFQKGFTNVHLIDFAKEPLDAFAKRNPDFPASHLHCDDFFQHQGSYDIILEQTLFCAIDPSLRKEYAKKVFELLTNKGKLVGVLFNRDFESGPPFGGNEAEYRILFQPYFSSLIMEECYNSILPRRGTELFINLQK